MVFFSKSSRFIILLVGFFAAIVGDVTAARDSFSSVTDSNYVYKVGLPNVPGVMYRNADGTPGGFSLELVAHILNDEHISYTWVDGTWGELFDKVVKGEIDVLPGTQVSEERKAKLDFLNNRFYTMWSELYVGRNVKFFGINDLREKRIGMMRNDNNGIGFIKFIDPFKLDVVPVIFETEKQAFAALSRQDIYAVAGSSPSFHKSILQL